MTRRAAASSLALCAFLVAGARAEEPADEPTLAFPTEIEQVTVDVVVVNDDGQPVTDLDKGDFEVFEDGDRQVIASFERFEVQVPARVAPEEDQVAEAAAREPVLVSRVSSNAEKQERQGRTFVIVFDDAHLSIFTAQEAKAAVKEFLEKETFEGDRVTLLAPGSGQWWTTTMPDGLEELLDMLDRQEGLLTPDMEKDRLSDYEAMRIHLFRDNMILDRVGRRYATFHVNTMYNQERKHSRSAFVEADPYVVSKAAEVYYAAAARNHATLGALKRALGPLVRIQGRKSIILVSEGFIYDTHMREFREILAASRRANAAIYFLNTAGLRGTPSMMDAEFSQLPSQEDIGFAFTYEYENSEGSESVALDTGGFVVRNSNDLTSGLKRIADENRAYYLIGYSPTNTSRDGSFRKIEVKLPNTKDVRIRARRGYYAPSDEGPGPVDQPGTDPEFQRVVDSPYDVDDIGLRMTHVVREETFLDKARVYLVAEVDVDDLVFETEEGLDLAHFNFLMVAVHRESGEYYRHDQKIDLKLSPDLRIRLARTWLPIVRDFELGPGHYRAKIVLRDKSNDRVGSVIHDFEVPEIDAFRVSTPVLSDMRQPTENGRPGDGLAIMARREFLSDSELFCQLDVYGATRLASSGMPRVSMAYEVRRSDGTLLTNEVRSLILPTRVGGLSRMIGFSLEWATPGDYELVMSVRDELSGKRLTLREPFTVVEGSAAPAAQAPAEDTRTKTAARPTGS